MASRSLGTLTLDLVAKTSQFTAGMTGAERMAKQRLGNIQRYARAAGQVLGTAIVAGAGLAAAGLAKYVANTIEAERVQAQLEARIKSTGGVAGQTLAELNKFSGALQFKTTFDDEAIGEAQALLLTFTKLGKEVFPEATEAVLNVATAMGTDLKSAAIQVGKALNDPVLGLSALSRSGIQFSEAQKDTIKRLVEVGDVASAQTIILRELETQFGGAAEAARNTLGGALIGLKNTFNDLLEGDVSGGGVKGTTAAINELQRTLSDPGIKRGIDTIANSVINLTGDLIEGASIIANYITQLNNVKALAGATAGDIAKASESALIDRQNAVQKTLADLQNGNAFQAAFRADSTLTAGDFFSKNETVIKRLKAEYLSLDKAISQARVRTRGVVVMDGGVPRVAVPVTEDQEKPTKTKGAGRLKKSDEEVEAERLIASYEGLIESLKERTALIGAEGEAAKVSYDIQFGGLSKLTEAQKGLALAAAEKFDADFKANQETEKAIALAEREVEQRERAIENTDRLLEDMQFELDIMGLSNVAREKAIFLRHLEADATDEQRAAASALFDELERGYEMKDFMDDFKDGLSDAFVDFATGAKSAKEAFGDFMDDLFARALKFTTDKAIDALFNSFSGDGKQQGGGGGLAALFGSFFGGARANGGPVSPSKGYLVGERGPEWFRPNTAGAIIPNRQTMGGAGVVQNIAINYRAPYDARTESQKNQKLASLTSEAARRNN